MTPLISIIIPCRNGALWLADAIESCLTQTWRNLQIIVVDDASTDQSLRIARRYESRGVTVLVCSRQIAGAARNVGLARAHGDFIQFLDADDVLDADKIRRQVERLASAASDSIASGAWARFRRLPSRVPFMPEPVWRDFAPEEFLIESWLGGGMMPDFAWLTPRAVIERAGPWNESLSVGDDGEFFSRVLLASSRVVFCGEARGFYRSDHHQSMSHRRDRAALVSSFAAVELSCAHLLRRRATEEARRSCAMHYQRFVYQAYPQAPDLIARAEQRIRELGGSELRPDGGRAFQILADGFGWKLAKSCQYAWHELRNAATTNRL